MSSVLGWDIGGVNTKAARVVDGEVRGVRSRAFELQRAPAGLISLLHAMASDLGATAADAHAVTMTAELSQMFRTKREGVSFVLDAIEAAFPGADVHVYMTDAVFVPPAAAREQPLLVAAANWLATATVVARHHANALLVDVGTTTTDVIPIVNGRVAVSGHTDLDRLASSELVYTGAVRTPVEAIVRDVPVPGGRATVAAEGFALAGDVHVWLGTLAPAAYEAQTPDGRPSAREFAGERLARAVCADREMLDEYAITAIAQAVADRQVEQIAEAMRTVAAAHESIATAVVTGLGASIAERAARMAGLQVVRLSDHFGADGARSAPANAVAMLLAEHLARKHAPDAAQPGRQISAGPDDGQVRLTVIKLGGGLLADPAEWRAALATIASAADVHRLVVVPGGGPFADAVRSADARVGLSDDAAHWMAIAGMDQHAEMIVAALTGSIRITGASGIADTHRQGRIPVLAPLAWLRAADPLPHSWDVTSDSIAAWVAAALGAQRLVLIKPAGAAGAASVDVYFARAVTTRLEWVTIAATEDLRSLLGAATPTAPEPSPR